MPDTFTDAAAGALFVPDTAIPPEHPVGTVRALFGMIDNPLKVWPRIMYAEPYHAARWMGRHFHYFRSPDHVRAMLHEHPDVFAKSPFQKRLLGPAVGEGLLSAMGEHWKFQRRAASPAFRIDALKALVPAFSDAAEAVTQRLLAQGGSTADIMGEMQHATLDVILETILGGADPGFQPQRVARSVSDYVEVMGKPDMLDMLGAPNWIPRPWAEKGRRAARQLQAAAVGAIARRKASGEERPDLLGLLLAARDPESGRGFTDIELRDNVVTFIAAGHETTALTLTYALYLIANSPDIQDRLAREARDVCGDGAVTADMLDGLVFHEQVIKEAMRLYPPVAIIDRIATSDLKVGDIDVKAGDMAFAMIYVMHRHEKLWDRPEAFDPDRFAPERAKGLHRFQFMPFGAGPRICIGLKFAYMEAIAILATMVRSVRFLPCPDYRLSPNIRITLRPEQGMPLRVEARGG